MIYDYFESPEEEQDEISFGTIVLIFVLTVILIPIALLKFLILKLFFMNLERFRLKKSSCTTKEIKDMKKMKNEVGGQEEVYWERETGQFTNKYGESFEMTEFFQHVIKQGDRIIVC